MFKVNAAMLFCAYFLNYFNCSALKFLFFPGRSSGDGKDALMHLGLPDDVDVCVELKDWLFALEGAEEMAERRWFYNQEDVGREERCWHTTFQCVRVKAKSSLNQEKPHGTQKYPVELVTVRISHFTFHISLFSFLFLAFYYIFVSEGGKRIIKVT